MNLIITDSIDDKFGELYSYMLINRKDPICNNGIWSYKIDINKLKEEMANENSRRRFKESNDTNVYAKAAKNIEKCYKI